MVSRCGSEVLSSVLSIGSCALRKEHDALGMLYSGMGYSGIGC